MDRIPNTKAEFDRLSFMSQCKVKDSLVTRNFVLLCNSFNIDELPRFKAILHKGDYEEIELMRARCNKSRVVQQFLMTVVRSLKKNPSWFQVLDAVLKRTSPDLYYALNPWEPRADEAAAGDGRGGGGGGGGPQQPFPPAPRGPYAKSTPLSRTRGIVQMLKPLCEGDTWRDLADELELTAGEQLQIYKEASSKRRDIWRVLMDYVIKRHGDSATVYMLLQALFNMGEEGRVIVTRMEEQGLIHPQGREGSEAGGGTWEGSSTPYDNVEDGSTSTLATQAPTPRMPAPAGPHTVVTCTGFPAPDPLLGEGSQFHQNPIQRSSSEVSTLSTNISPLTRAASVPASMAPVSQGFSPALASYVRAESLAELLRQNMDVSPPYSMEENTNQRETCSEPMLGEDKALNTPHPLPSPQLSAHADRGNVNNPGQQMLTTLNDQTCTVSGSLQRDSPSSGLTFPHSVAAAVGTAHGECFTAVASSSVSARSQSRQIDSRVVESCDFVSELIRDSQQNISQQNIARLSPASALVSPSLPEKTGSSPTVCDTQALLSAPDHHDPSAPDHHDSFASDYERQVSGQRPIAEVHVRHDQDGLPVPGHKFVFNFYKGIRHVQIGERNQICPLTSGAPVPSSPTAAGTDLNPSQHNLPPPTDVSEQFSERLSPSPPRCNPPPYEDVCREIESEMCRLLPLHGDLNYPTAQPQRSSSWDQSVNRGGSLAFPPTERLDQNGAPQRQTALGSGGQDGQQSLAPDPWEDEAHETFRKRPLLEDGSSGFLQGGELRVGASSEGSLRQQQRVPLNQQQPEVEVAQRLLQQQPQQGLGEMQEHGNDILNTQPASIDDVVDLRQMSGRSEIIMDRSSPSSESLHSPVRLHRSQTPRPWQDYKIKTALNQSPRHTTLYAAVQDQTQRLDSHQQLLDEEAAVFQEQRHCDLAHLPLSDDSSRISASGASHHTLLAARSGGEGDDPSGTAENINTNAHEEQQVEGRRELSEEGLPSTAEQPVPEDDRSLKKRLLASACKAIVDMFVFHK